MPGVEAGLLEVRDRIEDACTRSGRPAGEVELIAVSKTFGAEAVREAVAAGQRSFGESRLQEAEPKIAEVGGGLCWHFIGSIQRNKVRRILGCCQVLHSIDSLKLAHHVSHVSSELGLTPSVFLQVNLAGEETKGGFAPSEIRESIAGLAALKSVDLRGLMAIPPAVEDPEESRPWFRALRELRDELVDTGGVDMPFLSMGMSGDYEVAVEEGATHVRVGSAIFGNRSYRVDGELG